MIVPEEIRKCVVFLGYRTPTDVGYFKGTGFLLGRPVFPDSDVGPSFVYLVTAKHVILKLRNLGIDEVLIRMNYKDGQARWSASHIDQWLYHPTDANVDVAVLNFSQVDSAQLDHLVYPLKSVATFSVTRSVQLGLGEEIFMSGLFVRHFGQTRNIPIVRVGNIAALPEEKVSGGFGEMDAYLVEARSIGGLSGSPVFANLNPERHRIGNADPRFYLIGLMHGHWDADKLKDAEQPVNMGIGIVVPVDKILEVINQEAFTKNEEETRKTQARNNAPTMDSADDPQENKAFTRSDFENALKKVSRKVKPKKSGRKR